MSALDPGVTEAIFSEMEGLSQKCQGNIKFLLARGKQCDCWLYSTQTSLSHLTTHHTILVRPEHKVATH